jgi:hypothetical protein
LALTFYQESSPPAFGYKKKAIVHTSTIAGAGAVILLTSDISACLIFERASLAYSKAGKASSKAFEASASSYAIYTL